MALSPGTRLGPYEIAGPFGAGGQGEVYRARDTRLERTVAIKSVKDDFGDDPGRRARVEREARILAPLSHPNICALHDIVQEDGHTYLVMEALEGQTLATRLLGRNGRGLPRQEAVIIAASVADGLAFAHQHGVVHQDVKPSNIMLTPSGVKLLDFGIARLRRASQDLDVTLTAPLGESSAEGTLPYMAPEQLRGEVDPRSDLFALGAVLYEMLTGARAFVAETPAALATRIAESDPPPLPPTTASPALARCVMRCLAKDPAHRWQTAADLADELRWLATAREATAPPAEPARLARVVSLTLAALVGLGAAEVWVSWRDVPPRDTSAVAFTIQAPPGTSLVPYGGPSGLAFSPDGRQVVFVAAKRDGTDTLFLRSLSELEVRELPGTIGASYPFWSPDGRRIAFSQDGHLKRIVVGDGSIAVVNSDAAGPGTWGARGVILVAQGGRLRRIDVSHGSVADIGPSPTASSQADAPEFLPDGERFLYLLRGSEPRPGIYAGSLSNTTRTFVTAADSGAFESQGQLFFVTGSEVRRIAFEPKSASVTGEAVTLQRFGRISGTVSAFSVAENGAVAAILGNPYGTRLAWFDLKGQRAGTVAESEGYRNPVISPDGLHLAAERLDSRSGRDDVWVVDLTRGIGSRVTEGGAGYRNAAWSPEGTRLALTALPDRGAAVLDLANQKITPVGAPTNPPRYTSVKDWTRDGLLVQVETETPGTSAIWLLPVEKGPARQVVRSPAADAQYRQTAAG